MGLQQNVWNQVKNLTADEIISALEKDGWGFDKSSRGAIRAYIKLGTPNRRILIHYHPRRTYGSRLLMSLLEDAGWNEDDLRRLKLIR